MNTIPMLKTIFDFSFISAKPSLKQHSNSNYGPMAKHVYPTRFKLDV
jgi:hypothetical protein